jgi:hypothetical protein
MYGGPVGIGVNHDELRKPRFCDVASMVMEALTFSPLDLLVGQQSIRACLLEYSFSDPDMLFGFLEQSSGMAGPEYEVLQCFRCHKLVPWSASRRDCIFLCLDLPSFNQWSHVIFAPSGTGVGFEPYLVFHPLPDQHCLLGPRHIQTIRQTVALGQLDKTQSRTGNIVLNRVHSQISNKVG